ncbi:hypothetical protein EYC84_001164 [Monilinia fructicola]|uniref:CBS domain-containing protein n=1 Tax=Monilinia fructicola TaxID=38448 RepID=A0A5M9JP45_MONFR|nr:hypothetical protein EYC84_001164 [Monilinia fructicola]
MAMALGDALVIVTAEELHINLAAVFAKNHPGGAIGAAFRGSQKVSDLAISLADMPDLEDGPSTGADVLISAYGSESGWVRCGTDKVVPPCSIKQLGKRDMDSLVTNINGLMVPGSQWINISAETDVATAKEMYRSLAHAENAILAVMDDMELIGVLHIGDLA